MLNLLYLLAAVNIIRLLIIMLIVCVILWIIAFVIIKDVTFRNIVLAVSAILILVWLLREFGLI
jgi:ABC-type anion transport system duplicated permease subunit